MEIIYFDKKNMMQKQILAVPLFENLYYAIRCKINLICLIEKDTHSYVF